MAPFEKPVMYTRERSKHSDLPSASSSSSRNLTSSAHVLQSHGPFAFAVSQLPSARSHDW